MEWYSDNPNDKRIHTYTAAITRAMLPQSGTPISARASRLRTAEAVSLETVDRKAKNTINISNCLDIEKGTVTVSVENPESDTRQEHFGIIGR